MHVVLQHSSPLPSCMHVLQQFWTPGQSHARLTKARLLPATVIFFPS